MDWRGLTTAARSHKKKLYPRKTHSFVMEKSVEDAKQKEKDAPDLLEAVMRPTCFVKEELRPILFKLTQFRPEITKMRVCTFQMSAKIPDSSWTSPRAPLFPIIWPCKRPNIRDKYGFNPSGAGLSQFLGLVL